MSLIISPFGNPWQNHNNTNNHERSLKSLNSKPLVVLQSKSIPTTKSWKTLQEKSSQHDRLSQSGFLKHLNKTHQGIMCETEIRIAYIKKHVYKERKEITRLKVGEGKHTLSSYIWK